jgi:hypothetical protein
MDSDSIPNKSNSHYELTAYYLIPNEKNDSIIELRDLLYATFDNHGNCKVIQNYMNKMVFKQFKIKDSLITNTTNYFDTISAKMRHLSLRQTRPIIYDGPDIRINYICDTISKTIDYQAYYEVDRIPLTMIFDELYSLTLRKDFKQFSDTMIIKNLRQDMLYSIYRDRSTDLSRTINCNWQRIVIK